MSIIREVIKKLFFWDLRCIKVNKLSELIQYGYECEYLDFKEKQYAKDKHLDLVVDIMAMANSRHDGDKYIIIGIKDLPEGRIIKGIDPTEFVDSSNYTQIIHDTVEPEIHFEYFKYEYEGITLGVFRIFGTDNKPYMIKRKYEKLHEGFCKIRKGSMNANAKRSDFDYIYGNKGEVEVKLQESILHAVHDREECASIEVLIANNTERPLTIIRGLLIITNSEGVELTEHRVYGLENIVGADFKLSLPPKSEVVGQLYVRFGSSDPFPLNIDEYGIGLDVYNFEVIFWDARKNEYSYKLTDGHVFADGDFLWKVKESKGIKHKFRTH
ncbi:ATP-binding protein [Paenibacillus sp. D2_2]|uniref:AlbA family DNA-binding domain-containing protein n=1 Tax=Paenibacillus sp. D2_2 TaxID=3073092 RepID=UPI002814CAEE|nr:ATP-binding protein [Paenibacillus sp. D2_2]WMT40491.1 ATP-binding protein [Paenibacillus sp. D2_2]